MNIKVCIKYVKTVAFLQQLLSFFTYILTFIGLCCINFKNSKISK